MERLAWIEVLEAKPVSVGHPKGFRETSCPLDDVLRTHGLHPHSERYADIANIVVLNSTAIISLASMFGHSGTIPGDPRLDRDRELANSRDNNVADSLSPARTNSGDTVGVAAREPLAFTAFAELFERIGARRIEHCILPAAAMVLCANQ